MNAAQSQRRHPWPVAAVGYIRPVPLALTVIILGYTASTSSTSSDIQQDIQAEYFLPNLTMPESLTKQEVSSKTDPAVAKQYDHDTPISEQIQDFYKTVDGLKTGLLTTIRPNIGPVSRSMAVAKRNGPDFLFLANRYSKKFSDLESDKTCQITFQNSSTQDWVSITGEATTVSNEDPRIKELWNPSAAAWFGDLGDGVHTGKPEDPRMSLIEVTAKYISYWKATVGTLGFVKEVTLGAATGKVAKTGVQRELGQGYIEKMRKEA